jgi:predicted glycogen debranching enzyme
MIRFDQETCGNLDAALRREWVETNGLGGFASSTITGLNTRRYHGLLVAATAPPVGRTLLLSKLEETLVVDGRRYDLSANEYTGAIHPHGHQYQTGFRLDPFPVFTYEVAGVRVEKSVFMIHGENSTVIQYEVKTTGGASPRELRLEARPLIAFRDYHSTTHENNALNPHVEMEPETATVAPYAGLPPLRLAHNADEVEATGYWYRNFEYREERARGLDFREDLFGPCALKFDLLRLPHAAVIASTERRDVAHIAEYRRAEVERRRSLLAPFRTSNEFLRTLAAAADQFIVARGEQQTVIAGYHWFGDWGRDTMIALPGLTLTTARYDAARGVLLEFARYVDRGMLPNRFPDAGVEPEYNTVDATLWYFEAVRAYVERTGDAEFVRTHLYAVLADIIDWHERGTRYSIRVDADGLLHSGEPGVQLTWMDARVGDREVTPRTGKAVEIQALWYNALAVMRDFAAEFGDAERAARYGEMAARAAHNFNESFWNEAAGCLYDVVDGATRNAAIRPNQIFAVSLPHTMLARERARRVVETVERELLTPRGLRSLSPRDAAYSGRYAGGPESRDGVYHQGTVWAWLAGPFIAAYLRVNDDGPESRARAAEWLAGFEEHFADAGLGQVSEIFDGDAPHEPRGCIAQAWSVAVLLQAAEQVFDLWPSKRRVTSTTQ